MAALVRCGYVATGVIYGLVGLLAFLAATGNGGKATNQKGALRTLGHEPFGDAVLYAMAIGLAGYSIWRLLMAGFNPEGRSALKRLGYAITAAAYFAIAIAAFQVARGFPVDAGSPWVHWIRNPWGAMASVIVGLVLVAVAIAQGVNSVNAKFLEILEQGRMSDRDCKIATVTGRVGIMGRALVFLVTGVLLVFAGLDRNPSEAGGIEKALKAISRAPAGHWMLGAVAFCLVSYGIFTVVEARFRRITPA
jgi:ABC-type Na+ efflux pump permease subunit